VRSTLSSVDFPRDPSGKLQGMIHPQLQFQDYQPLHPGDPMFLTFTGEIISYDGNAIVYPIFINEAAYYEKGIAMTFTSKQQLPVENV
jgi:aspartoacylase